MAIYDYDAYAFDGDRPLVRISRRIGPPVMGGFREGFTPVGEFRLDWSWKDTVTVALGGDLYVSVYPHGPSTTPSWRSGARYGLVAFGRCSAFVRRWGATMPVDMVDPRVLEGLRWREVMEAMG